MRVDLNADLGEELDVSANDGDDALLALVTSASIACGGHAGSVSTMRRTIRRAASHGVAIGAHPGFADREHFGRRELSLSASAIEALVMSQVRTLSTIAAEEGSRLQHVKPHGALYNMAARDAAMATAIARATALCDASLILIGPAGSALESAAHAAGLRSAGEAFCDRAYRADGSLVPRTHAGAVIDDIEAVTTQALRIVVDGAVIAVTGERVAVRAQTLCIHSDTPGAVRLGTAVRAALLAAGVTVKALSAP